GTAMGTLLDGPEDERAMASAPSSDPDHGSGCFLDEALGRAKGRATTTHPATSARLPLPSARLRATPSAPAGPTDADESPWSGRLANPPTMVACPPRSRTSQVPALGRPPIPPPPRPRVPETTWIHAAGPVIGPGRRSHRRCPRR